MSVGRRTGVFYSKLKGMAALGIAINNTKNILKSNKDIRK